jgi:hypothetical protein
MRLGLFNAKAAGIDLGLVLVIQKGRIEALLRENLRSGPATHSPIMPILYKLSQQFEQLALYVRLARLVRSVLGNRNAAAHAALIREECLAHTKSQSVIVSDSLLVLSLLRVKLGHRRMLPPHNAKCLGENSVLLF